MPSIGKLIHLLGIVVPLNYFLIIYRRKLSINVFVLGVLFHTLNLHLKIRTLPFKIQQLLQTLYTTLEQTCLKNYIVDVCN